MNSHLKIIIASFALSIGLSIAGMEQKGGNGFDATHLALDLVANEATQGSIWGDELEKKIKRLKRAARSEDFQEALQLYDDILPLLMSKWFKKALRDFKLEELEHILSNPRLAIDVKKLLIPLLERAIEYKNELDGDLNSLDRIGGFLLAAFVGGIAYLIACREQVEGYKLVMVPLLFALIVKLLWAPTVKAMNRWGKNEAHLEKLLSIIKRIADTLYERNEVLDDASRENIRRLLERNPDARLEDLGQLLKRLNLPPLSI